jgi:hypothetical protein
LVWQTERKKDHLEVLGVEGRVLLKWILKKYYVSVWSGFIRLRTEANGVFLIRGNNQFGSIYCGAFLDCQRNY